MLIKLKRLTKNYYEWNFLKTLSSVNSFYESIYYDLVNGFSKWNMIYNRCIKNEKY